MSEQIKETKKLTNFDACLLREMIKVYERSGIELSPHMQQMKIRVMEHFNKTK
jgi:siderophore synthetase component